MASLVGAAWGLRSAQQAPCRASCAADAVAVLVVGHLDEVWSVDEACSRHRQSDVAGFQDEDH